MFVGPNGSGKSTIKNVVPPALHGVFLNPDEIEKDDDGMKAHMRPG
jgi:predicted ABC-type ATPase